MAKHSKFERDRRAEETERVRLAQAAWTASLPAETVRAFAATVAAVRARGPLPPRPDMAPGTPPQPPRPGHEPKAPKDERAPRRRAY